MASSSSELNHLRELLRRAINREREEEEEECNFIIPADSQALYDESRPRIIAWLSVLNDEVFHFDSTTLFLAIHIFDRFLRRVRAQAKYLACIGVTCLYLAAKNNEEDEMVPETRALVERSGCGCSVAEILRMELCILTKLSWNIRPISTAVEFMHLYHALLLSKCSDLFTSTHDVNLATLVKLLKYCLPLSDFLTYSPSTVALTVFSVYLELTWQYWLPATLTLQSLVQLDEEEMRKCRRLVSLHLAPELSRAFRNQSNTSANISAAPTITLTPTGVINPPVASLGGGCKSCRSEIRAEVLPLPAMNADSSPPLTPELPAKRRRVEQDDDVYDDIRSLYDVTGCDGLVLVS